MIEDDDKTQSHLVKMIFVQKTDIDYDSVDFDDPLSTLSYFKKLYLSFALSTKYEDADQIFNDLMTGIIVSKTKKDSKNLAKVKAHHIMRLAAEKIHGSLRELNQDSIPTTAEFLFNVMLEALDSLLELLSDTDDDDDMSKYFRIRNNIEKDAGVSKDHEVLG